jgi:hypothetical protein
MAKFISTISSWPLSGRQRWQILAGNETHCDPDAERVRQHLVQAL